MAAEDSFVVPKNCTCCAKLYACAYLRILGYAPYTPYDIPFLYLDLIIFFCESLKYVVFQKFDSRKNDQGYVHIKIEETPTPTTLRYYRFSNLGAILDCSWSSSANSRK